MSTLENMKIGASVIITTVDPDGGPHAAPFGSLVVISSNILRFGCDRRHDTYANIRRDGRVVVSVIAPPDIAVSIRGRARVVKDSMSVLGTDGVVEIEVEDVKDDLLPGSVIVSGIVYSVSKDVRQLIAKYINEVRES